jgi:hypothetical protein
MHIKGEDVRIKVPSILGEYNSNSRDEVAIELQN